MIKIVVPLDNKSPKWPIPKVFQINLQNSFKLNQHLTLMSYLRWICKYMIGIRHVSSQQTYMKNVFEFLVFEASLMHTTLDKFS